MSSKVYTNCGPCQDVPVERNVLIDCATGQPLVFPGANCNTPAWVKSCDPPQPECSLALAMNPITLEVVAVVACVSAGVPTFTQYNLDGTPYTGPQPVAIDKEWAFQAHVMCDNGVSTVTRTDVFLDGSNTPAFQIWQDMLGAVIAAPNAATLSYGACQVRRLVGVLAGHVCSGGAPAGFVGYDFDIPAQFPGSTNANDLYLHILYYNPGSTPEYYIPPGSNVTGTAPLLVTDPSIQAHIDAALVSWGLNPGDVLWQVNADDTVTVWYSPTFVISDLTFWAGPNTSFGYTGKEYPQIATTHQPTLAGGCSTCVEVQIEKYQNADGSIAEELYQVGTRTLVSLNPGDSVAFGPCPAVEAAPVPVADGYIVSIPGGGSTSVAFSAAVSSVAVHNLSNNVLQVQFSSPVGGNQFHYVAPGGAMTTAFDPGVLIPAVTINNLGALTADVIVNGLRPR